MVAKTSGTNWLWLVGTQATSISDIGYSISSTSDPGNKLSISVGSGVGEVAAFGLNGLVLDPTKYHKFITTFKTASGYEDSFWVKIDNKQMSCASVRNPTTSNSGPLGIGYGSTALYAADSQFHEVIIFNRKLTPDEIRSVEAYLNNRYGV